MALDQVDVDNYNPEVVAEMSFMDHLEALRWHLIRSLASVIVFASIVFMAKDFVFGTIIFGPKYATFITYRAFCGFSKLVGAGEAMCFSPPEFEFVTPGFGELFTTHLMVSLMIGVVISFPYIFWEVWRFIKPGLYDEEQKAARGSVFICSFLFSLGVLFGYYVISPFAITFLAGYQIEGVKATPALSSYVNYMAMFTIPVGIIFELPVVVYFLTKIGFVTPEFLRTYRKHAMIIILIMSAIITPPDVITQFLIGLPLFILYEISIGISKRVIAKQED